MPLPMQIAIIALGLITMGLTVFVGVGPILMMP